jgi:hypothetical protein
MIRFKLLEVTVGINSIIEYKELLCPLKKPEMLMANNNNSLSNYNYLC